MSHQGRCGLRVECNAKELRRCLDRLLPTGVDQQFVFAESCTWSAATLIATALFWAWSDEDTLTGRFRVARRITTRCFFLQQELSAAYQPFMRMLVRWSGRLQALLVAQLHDAMRAMDSFTENGFAIFAIDGSRFEVPRTAGNEQVFSPRDDNGKRKRHVRKKQTTSDQKKATSPQVWLTTLWHVGCGLPWTWKHGESGSSEREHLLQMLPELPDNALLTADAGFAGYEYWKAILDSQRNFLIRVGANVKLLKKLGYARESASRIYLWTDRAAAREQPPLVLRLVIVQGARHPVYLVTSVLSSAQMTDSQLSKIYARRWGVELYYRHLKQTFDLRKLRSRTAAHVVLELDWALVGLWCVCWLAQSEGDIKPRQLSVAKALRAVRRTMREYKSDADPGEDLFTSWANARIDNYQRTCKSSRDYPRKKRKRQLNGVPSIKTATYSQRRRAKAIKQQLPKSQG